jgi:Reverse transcriptase (RNA-dependent DNA polymerase)
VIDTTYRDDMVDNRRYNIQKYHTDFRGFLPQGSPTSPMLSNLAMVDIDNELGQLSRSNNFIYTRYSDDLVFSTKEDKTKSEVFAFQVNVIRRLKQHGFNYNRQKLLYEVRVHEKLSWACLLTVIDLDYLKKIKMLLDSIYSI